MALCGRGKQRNRYSFAKSTESRERQREKINIAKRIIKDRPGLEESLEAEKALIREWYFPERAQVKEKHYEGR